MAAFNLKEESCNKSFGGYQKVFSHDSKTLGCRMNFGIYLPPQATSTSLPVIYFLSGLTCSEQNFIQKAGAQRYASEHGVVLVNPDTSPRNLDIPGDSDSWDFGVGAGFYLNATREPWSKNYKMYGYVTEELPRLLAENFPVLKDKQSITGHSMGGHGALIIGLKNPGKYRSVSAFAPICNPSQCPWGEKAFSGYLGDQETGSWKEWDATELAKNYQGPPIELFIDQGTDDQFYKQKQLLPENLEKAAKGPVKVVSHFREGYDHSYFHISSFIGEHIKYHAKFLTQ